MKPLDSNSIIQVGIVVKDVEKAAKLYSELFGIEMPVIRSRKLPIAGRRFTPIPSSVRSKWATSR